MVAVGVDRRLPSKNSHCSWSERSLRRQGGVVGVSGCSGRFDTNCGGEKALGGVGFDQIKLIHLV